MALKFHIALINLKKIYNNKTPYMDAIYVHLIQTSCVHERGTQSAFFPSMQNESFLIFIINHNPQYYVCVF